jgi:hypothetical protein
MDAAAPKLTSFSDTRFTCISYISVIATTRQISQLIDRSAKSHARRWLTLMAAINALQLSASGRRHHFLS